MAKHKKSKRARTVKVEEDAGAGATPHGGAVFVDRTMRRLGVLKTLRRHMPERSAGARHGAAESMCALICALGIGGKGIGAAEILREDALAARVTGTEDAVPEEATMYRILTELAGLKPRTRAEAYEPVGATQLRMDIDGDVRPERKLRRVRSDKVEPASPEHLKKLRALLVSVATACLKKLKISAVNIAGFVPIFGDASDIEVEGDCFDAARRGRDGKKHLRVFTLMVGPILVALEVTPGNTDEGGRLPEAIRRVGGVVRRFGFKRKPRLALLDSAYFEKDLVAAVRKVGWRFVIGANQMRNRLNRLVAEQPETQWTDTGADARRGWIQSGVCAFTHLPGQWSERVNIVARRRREEGDLPGVWRYSFVGTDLEPGDLPADMIEKHGYAQLVWMLYGTKQGRENHYKQLLDEIGLHHPPSSRLGVNQVFYVMGAIASNVAMVFRYAVLGQPSPTDELPPGFEAVGNDTTSIRPSKAPEHDRGMSLRRVREKYFRVAATAVRSGRTLTVRLLTGAFTIERRMALMAAWHAASSL